VATVRSAEVEWVGGFTDGAGTIVSTTSGTLPALGVSWNARVGDEQALTSPEELLAAAHASCFAMQFTHGLIGAGGEPERMHVSAAVSFEPGLGITGSALVARVEVNGLADEKIREIAERAKLGCPVSRALAGIDITLELPELAPPPDEAGGEGAGAAPPGTPSVGAA
jgi:lipoyl-dependent peroxiredoxin